MANSKQTQKDEKFLSARSSEEIMVDEMSTAEIVDFLQTLLNLKKLQKIIKHTNMGWIILYGLFSKEQLSNLIEKKHSMLIEGEKVILLPKPIMEVIITDIKKKKEKTQDEEELLEKLTKINKNLITSKN